MISRQHRFRSRLSLSFVYKTGKTVRGPLFSVKSALNQRRQTYRLAVVVSRKVHKSAVARNRIRRRLYETVRLMEDEINQPYDIVITVFDAAVLETDPKTLTKQIHEQFKTAGLLS